MDPEDPHESDSPCRRTHKTVCRLSPVDPHAPARYRVNGPLSNLVEFEQAWHCPASAPMVRSAENRCGVW